MLCLLRKNRRQPVGKLAHGTFQLTQTPFDFVKILVRAPARLQDRVATEIRNTTSSGFAGSSLKTGELLFGKPNVHESGAGFLNCHMKKSASRDIFYLNTVDASKSRKDRSPGKTFATQTYLNIQSVEQTDDFGRLRAPKIVFWVSVLVINKPFLESNLR